MGSFLEKRRKEVSIYAVESVTKCIGENKEGQSKQEDGVEDSGTFSHESAFIEIFQHLLN